MTERECPYCKNTGFYQGRICVCISGLDSHDMTKFFRQIFGGDDGDEKENEDKDTD